MTMEREQLNIVLKKHKMWLSVLVPSIGHRNRLPRVSIFLL